MHKDEQKNGKGMSPLAAGVTGVVLGVAGTAAVALSDKDTRQKLTKKATNLKKDLVKKSEKTMHDLQAAGSKLKKQAEDKSNKMLESSKEQTKERN